ncbi:MAG: HAMP domain-containing sensor histidine kinase [Saprospiraceae bacterium]|nr:HAMP domain-containing sensor histidine kinase [Saprospiraceae bacterium]
MFKRALLYVVVMLILLALAVSAGNWGKSTGLLEQQAGELSAWLFRQIKEAPGSGAGTVLTHRADSLFAWSNAEVIPSKRDLRILSEQSGYTFCQLPQGDFLAFVEKSGENTRTTLVPIRFDENPYPLARSQAAPYAENLHQEELPGAQPVVVEGKTIGWLSAGVAETAQWTLWLQLAAWLLFFGIFLNLITQIGRAIRQRYHPLLGAAWVTLSATALLFLNVKTGFLTERFGEMPLFAPRFESASLIGRSVGEWLIHAGVLVFVMGFFHHTPTRSRNEPAAGGMALAVLAYLLAMMSVLIGMEALRQLVFNSRTGFDFSQWLNLGWVGILALAGVVAFMVGLFLFSHRLALGVRQLNLSRTQRWTAIAASAAIFGLICWMIGPAELSLTLALVFAVLYVSTLDAFAHWEGAGFGWAIAWLVLFSLFASTQLHRFHDVRDKKLRVEYAVALAADRDTSMAEQQLSRIITHIKADTAQIGRMLKPYPFKAGVIDLRDYLNRLVYEENYVFQHYRLNVYAFDRENQPILLGQTLGYEQVVLGNWATARPLSNANHIRFAHDPEGNARYLVQIHVNRMGDATQPATLYLFFDLKHPAPSRTFSQLFFNSPLKNLPELPRYDFSIAKNGRLTVDQGLANMTLLGSQLAPGAVAEFESHSRVDAVAKSEDGQTIAAVGHKSGGWLKQVYLFSFLFALAASCLLLLGLANTWLGFLPAEYDFKLTARGSLARRIHFWNVGLLAVSFIVVGYLTYQHFTRSAREAEQRDFNFRATALLTNLKTQALKSSISDDSLRQALPVTMTAMSGSLGMDAQFYDPSGHLLFSTQDELVQLGVLPAKMNPAALQFLQNNPSSERVESERAAGIPFFTQYRTLLNSAGQTLGYLAAPYPADTGKTGPEVSDFIGMLASLYVFLLLVAYAVTFILARSVTRPVSLLSEKVQVLRLEDKNEPLNYSGDSDDEISQLIGQYNHMVEKLEASKAQLVKLEREGAWREMARQVAHDIKNPLTTMKLSMQQLERVSGNPEQAAAYLRKAITRLIEQIDSLAQIASEFSMFANLDIKHKNDVVINEVVENVHDLFSEQKHVDLSLSLPDERFHILGDKNHLIRVFNNLVINAIQAIPSDRRGQIRVSLSRQGDISVIQISDNGGGIPPEIRDRVFEPNFTTKTSGSGLGLAICKKIIEAHDGTIRFETRDNEGTDFFVEVPVVAVD